ncbi:MAG: EAL domain-containing protein [Eggerthellales bacterium]|nr:EAL domain-containing protein [Eggerthellales bacterium]
MTWTPPSRDRGSLRPDDSRDAENGAVRIIHTSVHEGAGGPNRADEPYGPHHHVPLDVVRLDMSFMRDLDDPRRLGLLEACIRMVKGLGFLTVSEGVETAEQAELIRSLGGDAIQGYYCSKPLSESDFEQYLKEHA